MCQITTSTMFTMDLNVEKYKTHKVIQTLHIYENGKEIEYE